MNLVLTANFFYTSDHRGPHVWRCTLCGAEAGGYLTPEEARDDWHENHKCPEEAPALFELGGEG